MIDYFFINIVVYFVGLEFYIIFDFKKVIGKELWYILVIKKCLCDDKLCIVWDKFCRYFDGRIVLERIVL